MRKLFKIYDTASMVATIWCLAPLLPMALAASDDKVAWMPYAASIIIFIYGFSIINFRREKIKEGEWGYSDLAAYIVVPCSLFIFFSMVIAFTQIFE